MNRPTTGDNAGYQTKFTPADGSVNWIRVETLVHGLHRLFESGAWSRPRNAGLNLTDRLPE